MKVALFNVDSKIPNLALMKLSSYHKQKGDIVSWYSPLFHNFYDKIYASKIFTYPNLNDNYLRADMIKGGSGFRDSNGNVIRKDLPESIEHLYPDYSLYNNLDYSMGFITRGCIRKCKFCIVPQKENFIKKNADLSEFTKDQDKVLLLDNNILAYEDHIKELQKLKESKKRIDFTQGLDIRLINNDNAKLLYKIKMWPGKQIRFAFDDPRLESTIEEKLHILEKAGFKFGNMMFYVLIGFNTTESEDMSRINFLKKYRIDPYVMPYNKDDHYQKALHRWVNLKSVFWSKTWEEFLELRDSRNRKCVKEYLEQRQEANC